MKQITLLLIFCFISLFIFAQDTHDVIYLKNGSVIKGQITELIPDKHVKIETSDGNIFVYTFSDVEKIEKEAIGGLSSTKKETAKPAIVSIAGNINTNTKQGNIVVSGSTGIIAGFYNYKDVYDGETYDKYSMNTISLSPSFGYFIMDDLAVGLASTISLNTYKDEDGDKSNQTTYMVIPTAIYYFNVEGNVKPLVQAGVGFGGGSYKYIPKSGNDSKSSSFGPVFNFGTGAAYFVNDNISINFGLSYTIANFTDSDDNKYKTKQGNFGVNIGIAVYL